MPLQYMQKEMKNKERQKICFLIPFFTWQFQFFAPSQGLILLFIVNISFNNSTELLPTLIAARPLPKLVIISTDTNMSENCCHS